MQPHDEGAEAWRQRLVAGTQLGAAMIRWSDLSPGDTVCVKRHDTTVTQGMVDLVSEDGSVLWIHRRAGAGRMLFLREDGFSVHKMVAAPTIQERIRRH